jgi:hypothetical protein
LFVVVRKILVALGGGTMAFVIVVLLNRGLVAIGFSVKKHPEVGPVALTWAAIVVGVIGTFVGFLSASDEPTGKASEFVAAALGSIIAVYVIVVAGAIAGAFQHVHFNGGRLAVVGAALICRGVCQVGVFGRVRWAGVWVGGREAGASGSVSALPV